MKLFNNTEVAFALKSDSQLERAHFLFKMIKSKPMVRIGTAVTNFALKAHLPRAEEHTSELQSLHYLVCRLLLTKKKIVQSLCFA